MVLSEPRANSLDIIALQIVKQIARYLTQRDLITLGKTLYHQWCKY